MEKNSTVPRDPEKASFNEPDGFVRSREADSTRATAISMHQSHEPSCLRIARHDQGCLLANGEYFQWEVTTLIKPFVPACGASLTSRL